MPRTLTVHARDNSGASLIGAGVSVLSVDGAGDPVAVGADETALPVASHYTTDSNGIAVFDLEPSPAGTYYCVRLTYGRTVFVKYIVMPDEDSDLHDLPRITLPGRAAAAPLPSATQQSADSGGTTMETAMRMGTIATTAEWTAADFDAIGTIDGVDFDGVAGTGQVAFWLPSPQMARVVSLRSSVKWGNVVYDFNPLPVDLTIDGVPGQYRSTGYNAHALPATYFVRLV